MSQPPQSLPNNPQLRLDASWILVGNGPSALRGSQGKLIDAHDEVVRFNTYHIKGFERHVGRKTTLWSTFGRGTLPFDPQERPRRVLYIHGDKGGPSYQPEVVYRIPRPFFNALRQRVRVASKLPPEAVQRIIPSSGLLVALWLLDSVGVKHVKLTGFDHFCKERSKQHHYWMPTAFGKPKEHDGEAEKLILSACVASGRVSYLCRQ